MKFAFPRALHSRCAPRPANIAYAVESALATFTSCYTIALAIAVCLSSSMEDCTACSAPTTCSRTGARCRRSPYKRYSSALSLLGSEGAISCSPLLVCRPLSLGDCLAVCFILRSQMGGPLVAMFLSILPMDTCPCLRCQATSRPQSHSIRQAQRPVARPFFLP